MTWPNTAYLPFKSGRFASVTYDLAVREPGVARMRHRHGASCVRPLAGDFGHANRLSARRGNAAPPVGFLRHVPRLRIAPLNDKARHGAVNPLAIIEAAPHQRDHVRDRLRRSSGYVSNAKVPLDVSTTITGPGPLFCAATDIPAWTTHTRSTAARTAPRVMVTVAFGATPICGQYRPDDALAATRIHGPAHILSPRHEIQIDVRPPACRRRLVERLLGLVGCSRAHPAQPVRDAVNVGIHTDVPEALERENQDEVRGFSSNSRQRQQFLHRRRHTPAEPVDEDLARRLHVSRLVSIEADRIDQPLDPLHGELRHRPRRPRDGEQTASTPPASSHPACAPTAACAIRT